VSRTIAGAGEIRAGFSDLQTWMTSCVQTLRALAETPPIASPRVEAAAAPARRIDEVDRIRRHLLVFTVMNWVEHADVPCERLVSVIMPTRNRHEWIGRAIASVQAQTYTRWELVVVDDGSSDGTPALLADVAAKDERIRHLRIEHQGAPAARNAGMGSATGEIVAYLDDDNVMHEGWLKAVVWAFSCWPQTDVLYGARIIEDTLARASNRSGNMPSIEFAPWDRRRLELFNFVDQNVIAHRAGLPEAHFDEALRMCQDWELFLRLTARREPLELPAIACLYSTTAPDRGSEQPDLLDSLRKVRARAHLGRPLRLLALPPTAAGRPNGRIEADLAALAGAGAEIASADTPPLSAAEELRPGQADGLAASVSAHDPDIVLVYGSATAVAGLPALEEAARPFAVREMAGDPGAGGTLRAHPLLLGVWSTPQQQGGQSAAAGFVDELSNLLHEWKLAES
jgi:hypothetical protein